MELKPDSTTTSTITSTCLNRTFYGIETEQGENANMKNVVLIVPFMELKLH